MGYLTPITQILTEEQYKEEDDFLLIPDKVLMSEGTWNDYYYSKNEIENAYAHTDWEDKKVNELYLDHKDSEASAWVGFVKNPRISNGMLLGDLAIYDDATAKKIKAGAKFGISPKVNGIGKSGAMKKFNYLNFSIVTNPAVKTAFINNFQKIQKEVIKNMAEEKDEEIEEELEEEEETEEEMAAKKKYPYPYKKEMKKKKKEEEVPEEEEMSDNEFLEVTSNSEWTDFIKKMKGKYPKMSFSDIAKAFKKKMVQDAELEQSSDEDLLAQLKRVSDILKKREKYPYPKEEDVQKMNEEIKSLNAQVQELSQKVKEPEIQTLANIQAKPKNTNECFIEFLHQNVGKSLTITQEK